MKKILIISTILLAILCTGCAGEENIADVESVASSSSQTASSEISLKEQSSTQALEETSSESSSKPAVSSSAPASSKKTVSSQLPKKSASSKQTLSRPSKVEISDTPDFGELMDEATVDAIIAEGIEYANSKGMTWYEDFSVKESGYYNPAFSGAGAEIFKRDLFYHIDQVYDITAKDADYYDGCLIYYKIVKGEFHEKGYWYGYVLY